MHGNVSEWVFDRWGGMTTDEATDPTESNGKQDSYSRGVRGGSWGDPAGDCRSGARPTAFYTTLNKAEWGLGETDRPYVGFRIAAQVEIP